MKKTRKEKGEEEVEKKEEEKKLLNEPEKNVSNLQVVPEETPIRGRDSFSAQRARASHLWPSPLPPGQKPCQAEPEHSQQPTPNGEPRWKCMDHHVVLAMWPGGISHSQQATPDGEPRCEMQGRPPCPYCVP